MSDNKTNLTYPKFTQADINKAKLELLQEVYRRLQSCFGADAETEEELQQDVNNVLSNIYKEHKLG